MTLRNPRVFWGSGKQIRLRELEIREGKSEEVRHCERRRILHTQQTQTVVETETETETETD